VEASKVAKIPDAVPVVINGMPAIYLEVPESRAPMGAELALTRLGELAPFSKGVLAPGATILVIGPDVAQALRSVIGTQLAAAARQAAVQRNGAAGL
jgi:hypothetical protein